MEYTVIWTKKLEELIEKVNLLIKDGWIPQGGICESASQGAVDFYQAMVRN